MAGSTARKVSSTTSRKPATRGTAMTMNSYAVYDPRTGEVVHLHVEPAGLDTSPEEILQLADPGRTRSLEVIRVPREGLRANALHVVDGELRAASEEVSHGAAG